MHDFEKNFKIFIWSLKLLWRMIGHLIWKIVVRKLEVNKAFEYFALFMMLDEVVKSPNLT